MRAQSAHHADVFSHLRGAVGRELAVPEVAELLAALVARGWEPRQLRHRVGALPAQPSAAQDAEVITACLRGLLAEPSPQQRYDEDRLRREDDRARAARDAPRVAGAEDRDRWIAGIRSGLKGRPRSRAAEPVRLRPDCALCHGEAQLFVRRDVHLCSRCVDLLAAGEVHCERSIAT
jgi:hypothetical protein